MRYVCIVYIIYIIYIYIIRIYIYIYDYCELYLIAAWHLLAGEMDRELKH